MKALYSDSPYWEAAKFAFAIAGGAAVASTIVAGTYKLVKKGATLAAGATEEKPQSKDEDSDSDS